MKQTSLQTTENTACMCCIFSQSLRIALAKIVTIVSVKTRHSLQHNKAMLHLLKGKIEHHSEGIYITSDNIGIEVQYAGKQTVGTFFLIPYMDESTKSMTYFAFDSHQQKERFRKVLKISGIGNKTAFQLAYIPKTEIKEIVQGMKIEELTQFPGIGTKTAKRIIIELKQEFSTEELQKLSQKQTRINKQIIGHLANMGYNKDKVQTLLDTYPKTISPKTMNTVITRLIKKL